MTPPGMSGGPQMPIGNMAMPRMPSAVPAPSMSLPAPSAGSVPMGAPTGLGSNISGVKLPSVGSVPSPIFGSGSPTPSASSLSAPGSFGSAPKAPTDAWTPKN